MKKTDLDNKRAVPIKQPQNSNHFVLNLKIIKIKQKTVDNYSVEFQIKTTTLKASQCSKEEPFFTHVRSCAQAKEE